MMTNDLLKVKLFNALKSAVRIANEAFDEWDGDNDVRVGKILRFLGDPKLRGYRADIDAIHEVIQEAKEIWHEKKEPALPVKRVFLWSTLVRALPDSDQIEVESFEPDSVRFIWRGQYLRATTDLLVSETGDCILGQSPLAMLVEEILRREIGVPRR